MWWEKSSEGMDLQELESFAQDLEEKKTRGESIWWEKSFEIMDLQELESSAQNSPICNVSDEAMKVALGEISKGLGTLQYTTCLKHLLLRCCLVKAPQGSVPEFSTLMKEVGPPSPSPKQRQKDFL